MHPDRVFVKTSTDNSRRDAQLIEVPGDQEQRTAPQQNKVGVVLEVTWNVGGPRDHLDTFRHR